MKRPRHPKPTDLENAGRAIRKAAQVLSDREWTQGTWLTQLGAMCAVGAIQFAVSGHALTGSQAGARAANEMSIWLGTAIPHWNDTKGRTKEEVIQMMQKFADEVDPQRP